MGSILKEQSEDIKDSEVKEYKEVCYKLFQLQDYKVRASNGEFRCPFCACKDEPDYGYAHLLQHAIRVSEGSISGKQRVKHSAMARYLAVDLGSEVNAGEDGRTSDEEWVAPSCRKRSRSGSSSKINRRRKAVGNVNAKVAMAEKREKEALDRVKELERKMNEMRNENAVITRERNELQRREKEALDRVKELERKMNGMRNAVITRVRNEFQTVRTAVIKWDKEVRYQVKELKRKMNEMINEEIAVITRERNELQRREKEALDQVKELERKMNEMRNETNAVITRERNKLQGVRTEQIKEKALSTINKSNGGQKCDNSGSIGVKKIKNVVKRARKKRIFPAELVVEAVAEIRGIHLCSKWQAKLKSWWPLKKVRDDKGVFKWEMDEKDATLSAMKNEWGDEAYNAVLAALADVHRYEILESYNAWNWNKDLRKGQVEEVISWLNGRRR